MYCGSRTQLFEFVLYSAFFFSFRIMVVHSLCALSHLSLSKCVPPQRTAAAIAICSASPGAGLSMWMSLLCACVWGRRSTEVDIPAPRWMLFMTRHYHHYGPDRLTAALTSARCTAWLVPSNCYFPHSPSVRHLSIDSYWYHILYISSRLFFYLQCHVVCKSLSDLGHLSVFVP